MNDPPGGCRIALRKPILSSRHIGATLPDDDAPKPVQIVLPTSILRNRICNAISHYARKLSVPIATSNSFRVSGLLTFPS
jgi:hypothetical protein